MSDIEFLKSVESNTNNKKKMNCLRGYSTSNGNGQSKAVEIDIVTKIAEEPTVPKRKCILCVRGHVDTGKTSFVSLLSSHTTNSVNTQINQTEAGMITQQVGTQTFERENIIKFIPEQLHSKFNMDFVTIDTPGHTDFESIRRQSSQIAHIILVFVDIIKGIDEDTMEFLQENVQTREDYNKIILVLNKIDRINDYKKVGFGNLKKMLNKQSDHTRELLDRYYTNIIVQLSNYQLYAEPYYKKKQSECIAMVPISAKTGDGIPDLLLYMSNARLTLEEPTSQLGYIIDKRNDNKIGKMIVGIMKYGSIGRSNTITLNGSVFPIKHLFHFGHHDSRQQHFEPIDMVNEATAFAFTVDNAHYSLINVGDSFEPTEHELTTTINVSTYEQIETRKTRLLSNTGVFVITPSDSMIEGINSCLAKNNISMCDYAIGNIDKKDVIKFNNKYENDRNLEYNKRYKAILICLPNMTEQTDNATVIRQFFDTEVLNLIRINNIHVVIGGTIFKLVAEYNKYIEMNRREFVNKYGSFAQFTATSLPKCIFRENNPILCGVKVNSGVITIGSIITDSKGNNYGTIEGIMLDKKAIEVAKPNMEVCLKIVNGNQKLAKTQIYEFCNQESEFSSLVINDINQLHAQK